jgi:hypothetical protein
MLTLGRFLRGVRLFLLQFSGLDGRASAEKAVCITYKLHPEYQGIPLVINGLILKEIINPQFENGTRAETTELAQEDTKTYLVRRGAIAMYPYGYLDGYRFNLFSAWRWGTDKMDLVVSILHIDAIAYLAVHVNVKIESAAKPLGWYS